MKIAYYAPCRGCSRRLGTQIRSTRHHTTFLKCRSSHAPILLLPETLLPITPRKRNCASISNWISWFPTSLTGVISPTFVVRNDVHGLQGPRLKATLVSEHAELWNWYKLGGRHYLELSEQIVSDAFGWRADVIFGSEECHKGIEVGRIQYSGSLRLWCDNSCAS